MVPKNLVILGSTGSIGRSCLEVIADRPGRFAVRALAAHSNAELLAEQYRALRPPYLCLVDDSRVGELRQLLKGEPVEIVSGEDELVRLATLDAVDMVVNAVVGAAGLRASLETVRMGRMLALANKESLVCGGPLFPPLIQETGARILPIDSEHSAIWQLLACGRESELKRIVITASGGPFRDLPTEKFSEITVKQALEHPTWKMGPKITIDSATLVNKGLEVIEAVVLFSVPADKISVVIHPQSVIHSMVEFIDSSVVAQLSMPDMKLPIVHALFWPERVRSDYGAVDFERLPTMTFDKPDLNRFRALRIAYEVAARGGTAPAIYNAANEVAVKAFLESGIKFPEITDIIENSVDKLNVVSSPGLDDILEADRKARETARELMGKLRCC
ncbi:MAG: 1-deoxy-D-xylulose-5-phosphate reductoisomerase [Candidatus Zixiibacteriota bacterium]|nr:MAG: 1-deoxy-D-xylulose-5-phosphate reductoisomerase [candidate division Zixibacteria bacterium]